VLRADQSVTLCNICGILRHKGETSRSVKAGQANGTPARSCPNLKETNMMKFAKFAAVVAATSLIASAMVAEARPNRVKARGQNGVAAGVAGPNGAAVRGRGAVRNADGSVTAASGGAAAGINGGRGFRGATTTVNPDGSARRQSAAGVSGARGSAATQSDLSRSADGTLSGGRTTNATSNVTGNSYNGSTQIDPATGKPVRTATCTDATGAVITCPR
jgi:hypothetical protein